MARKQKITVTSEKVVRYNGYFEARELYSHIKNYMEEEKHYDVTERNLEERCQDGKREIVSKIDCEGQFNDYYLIVLSFILDLRGDEMEVEDKGRKRMVTKGSAMITVNCFISPDYLNKRDAGPLGEFLGKIYDKFLGEEELKSAIMHGVKDVGALLAEFKKEVKSKL